MSVLISVVIPTRCREETLKASLHSAVEQDFDDYEIIVSDNNSEDKTREVVESFNNSKVRYVNPGKRLSMCDNWEFALSHVKGEYVIFIGDDDAVVPAGLKKLAHYITATKKADAYMWPNITYWWPMDDKPPWVTNHAVEMVKRKLNNDDQMAVVENNLKEIAIRTLKHGLWRYSDLPMVYHNAVSTKVLKAIARSSGRVFHSNAPDFVTFLEIPVFADTVVRLSYPVTIFGVSAKSNGGSGTVKDGRKVMQQFIEEYGQYKVHHSIPPCLDIGFQWYIDNFLVAKDLFPSLYGGIDFNYSAMWAFLRRAGYIKNTFVYKHLKEIKQYQKFSLAKYELYCLAHDFFAVRRRLINRNMGKNVKTVPENNILDYVRVLAKEINISTHV